MHAAAFVTLRESSINLITRCRPSPPHPSSENQMSARHQGAVMATTQDFQTRFVTDLVYIDQSLYLSCSLEVIQRIPSIETDGAIFVVAMEGVHSSSHSIQLVPLNGPNPRWEIWIMLPVSRDRLPAKLIANFWCKSGTQRHHIGLEEATFCTMPEVS